MAICVSEDAGGLDATKVPPSSAGRPGLPNVILPSLTKEKHSSEQPQKPKTSQSP
ncbi:hypothetical protein BN1723_004739 [Verticillium longisporum]|uniref:Uncharacterized protein n=1 Tax=Verticillium longisporum TaxID=100787 RepID=A0A0G4N0Z3_VERLO|nr:hypothetical protein BN1723_004739 [Verticillium longisporum]